VKTSPLYLGIDFGTTNSSVAYIYADPRHLSARYVPVEPVPITMDAENNLMAERMPSLVSTRFDDRRATGLAGGWEVLRIFGRRKKAPLLRRGRELFESVKSDLGSSRIYAHASSPECQTPRKVARAIFRGLLHEARERLPGLECARVRTVITIPASLNADARQETRDAAVEAGLNADLVELIDEPMTPGNRPVCLVESGTPLPFPGEGVHAHPSDFFVPQNGQKELIIPFYAGSTEGNPRLSGNLGAKDDGSAGQTLKLLRPQFKTKHDGN
jgi:hypothetical protein